MNLFTVRDIDEIFQKGFPLTNCYWTKRAQVAQIILCNFLDRQCLNQLFEPGDLDRRFDPARRYIRMDDTPDTSDAQEIRSARISWLAEGLLNLQRCTGFEKVVEDITNGNFQAAWEEVVFAAHFAQSGISVEFLHPSQQQHQKTAGFKIAWNGCEIYCEVEGKQEGTASTYESTRNTLEHARKQLPKNCAGIICLKIPEAWKAGAIIPVFSAIEKFLSRTDRVVGVLVRSERQTHHKGGTSALKVLIRNFSSKLLVDQVAAVLDQSDKCEQANFNLQSSDLLAFDENSTSPIWITIDAATNVICQVNNIRCRRLAINHLITIPEMPTSDFT